MNAPTPCHAILTPSSDGEFGLRFALSNPTQQAISLSTYEPFLQFHVGVTVGGSQLAVVQPTLDIPVRPMTITVPPSGTVEIVTPVRLRFLAGAPPSQDRFVWSIAHEPKGVQLTFSLDLPPPFDQPFQIQL
jgi:hypothetical protein